MFKPKTLKEATSLARMKDEQLQRQRRISRPPLATHTPPALPTTTKASPIKRLPWDEMQRRRAQGLCFNYDDKFSSSHRCRGPQLLLLEGNIDDESKGDNNEANIDLPSDPKISLHALTGWTAAKTMRVTAKIGTYEVVQQFTIESDASEEGIGVVLTQQGKPIAFMSQALGVSKLSWSTYTKEMLAIIHAIRTWRPYLFGQKFYIQTDQRSLKYLLEQRMVTLEQQKWVAKLLGYDYDILYKPGRENSVVDALSCVTDSPTLNVLFISQAQIWEDIKTAAEGDAYMDRIGKLAATKPGLPYTKRNGLILYKNRVVVPPKSQIPDQLLREFHDFPLGDHSGVLRTYKRIAQQFYWPSMYRMVNERRLVIQVQVTLPPLNGDGAFIIEPEEIIDTRWIKKGGKFLEESLVKWKRLPIEDATWENAAELQDKFLDLNLEDKVPVKVGDIDKSRRSRRVSQPNQKYLD
ncbi:hypothetical protein F0562_021162 [Nyssa sinensis]|uniref:Chromo domain-containing protein n=1 Tax=Nyssa sinensis TaxID=561372 RepID=A0A5J5BJV5_9ASTE|nr:hypothetical protein F0562_021162 [Nyssa sinensis]